jgi:anti-sigma B factor antagonist
MAPLEEVAFEQRGDVVVASLRGEVDLSNAATVKEQLLGSVPNSASALVLDLTDTDYLDSTGVQLIFELVQRLGHRGQRIELVVPENSVINRLLVLTEMNRVVAMSSSVDLALRN